MTLSVYVSGIGMLGPGFESWRDAVDILTGRKPYAGAPTVLPVPAMLPSAERRRTGRVVKLALAVALEATENAAADPTQLASVFSSSGADGHICHEICQALASPAREVSPTRFSNSVHNAAAGYWSIATGSMSESNVVCAFDASFCAGLLEAMTQTRVEQRDILLVAYDTEYPPPLHAKRPIPDGFGIGMVLTPAAQKNSQARLQFELTSAAFERLADPALEALRASIPAARALPMMRLLAARQAGNVVVEYLSGTNAAIRVEPCC
jgi:hypothetical protein